MRTKNGLPKRKALRRMPEYTHGFRTNPAVAVAVERCRDTMPDETMLAKAKISAVSFFAGCGGLDLGALGGFRFHGTSYPQQAIDILGAYDSDPKRSRPIG